MADKLPKFMIAENPMADDRLFIYHSRKPRLIAEVLPDNSLKVVDWIDDPPRPERIEGLMKRLRSWFIAYRKWDDETV